MCIWGDFKTSQQITHPEGVVVMVLVSCKIKLYRSINNS